MSCGQDAIIYLWRLYPELEEGGNTTNPVSSFKLLQKTSFSSVACHKPELKDKDASEEIMIYATGSDRSIREIKHSKDN